MSTATRKPRVFISRTTAGLAVLAERVAEVLRQRGIEPIIQTGFYPSTHDVRGMLAEHLQQQLTNPYGKKMGGKKWNPSFCHPCFCHHLFRPAFAPEPPELAQRQQTFITEFAKDGRNTYGTSRSANAEVGMSKCFKSRRIRHSKFPIRHFPGPLFKGRDEFLAELRQHLTAEGPVVSRPDHPVSKCFRRRGAWSFRVPQTEAAVSKVDTAQGLRGCARPMIVSDGVLPKRVLGSTGKRTIHGMGCVGKTRAAIEYVWKHAVDYRALLFISAETLHRNLAALCEFSNQAATLCEYHS